jgi:hypothetical protein
MPYDNDGSVLAMGDTLAGIDYYPTGSQCIYANGSNNVVGQYDSNGPKDAARSTNGGIPMVWLFFPEQREITGLFMVWSINASGLGHNVYGADSGYMMSVAGGFVVQGSNDTTNGLDGSWATATLGSGSPSWVNTFSWRSGIVPVSFTGAKKVLRVTAATTTVVAAQVWLPQLHLYGQKGAGQTPDDILYLDGQNSYAEFTAPEDFGDVPLGTTTTRTFKVKNGSATKTANSINLQCNDADFAISSDGSTWVTTINISSLAAGASSAVLYVRNTTPSAGNLLGPRYARIVATVGSWT